MLANGSPHSIGGIGIPDLDRLCVFAPILSGDALGDVFGAAIFIDSFLDVGTGMLDIGLRKDSRSETHQRVQRAEAVTLQRKNKERRLDRTAVYYGRCKEQSQASRLCRLWRGGKVQQWVDGLLWSGHVCFGG